MFSLLQTTLEAKGADATNAVARRSSLVLAPHPDDETLGCGGTIALKRAQGVEVDVVIAADGSRSHRSRTRSPGELAQVRRREALDACAQLGVPQDRVHFLDLEDQTLRTRVPELVERLEAIVRSAKPKEILAPCGLDWNPDHQALAAAAQRLVAQGVHRGAALAYPVWFWRLRSWLWPYRIGLRAAPQLLRGPVRAALTLRPLLVRIGSVRERKAQALAQHRTQVANPFSEPGWATLEPLFLRHFFRRFEMFFPLGQAETLAPWTRTAEKKDA